MVLHMANHALGLVSLDAAERGLGFSVALWHSLPGSLLLYGAAATHITLAFVAIYDKPVLRLTPLELVRILAGFSIPVVLVGHLASTRVAFELHGAAATYARVVGNIWAGSGEARQLALLAPGWLHGCIGIYFATRHRAWFARARGVLAAIAFGLPVLAGLGFLEMVAEIAARGVTVVNVDTQVAGNAMRNGLLALYFTGFVAVLGARWMRVRRLGRHG